MDWLILVGLACVIGVALGALGVWSCDLMREAREDDRS